MPGEPAQHQLANLDALKVLAHPRRQRILEHLTLDGPATSATLARDLRLNTGATSYHLRELARHGLVAELPERAHGRERWWRQVPADIRLPLPSEQDAETRAVMDELIRTSFVRDVELFDRARVTAGPDSSDDSFRYSRGTIRVSSDRLAEFFEEYIALINRYSEPNDDDARMILTRFLAFPAPGTDADARRSAVSR